MPPAKVDKEALVILLDIGAAMLTMSKGSTYLQTCVDIVQMVVQRKMFAQSKDELALVLFGSRDTANELWDGSSDHFTHVTVARPLSSIDWKLLEFIQNDITATTIQGDIIDGLVVASNEFHNDVNKGKVFKDKRIIVLSDFSSSSEDDGDLGRLCKGLSKHGIRVDVISPFSDHGDEDESKPRTSQDASNTRSDSQKEMTKEQRKTREILGQVCESSEGAMYSFDEVLTSLSTYQARDVKSAGTKYQMRIGTKFVIPVVSVIMVKENKPDLFKLKRVYAKDETVELKTERTRVTKDEEQRDLDEKEDVIDAYRYGTTYIPIDDPESLRLKAEKGFDILGFTKSSNVKRHYFMSEGVNQIQAEPSAGENIQEAFVSMVHAMFDSDVYGIVRRVYSVRSDPELAALIPYITSETTCLLYMALPFDNDVRRLQLENFNAMKKYTPSEEQLSIVDELIDSMDLTHKSTSRDKGQQDEDEDNEDEDEDEDEDEEIYDPHTTFNPYIQRMFKAIACRAKNPTDDLPDFSSSDMPNRHLYNIDTSLVHTERSLNALKRCAEAFPTRSIVKKSREDESTNIFEKRKNNPDSDADEDKDPNEATGLDALLKETKDSSKKIKQIGTTTPVEDFTHLADKLDANSDNEFEDLCVQLQLLTRDFLNEAVSQLTDQADSQVVQVFEQKCADCIRVQRAYSLKRLSAEAFNVYLKTFRRYLIQLAANKKNSDKIENFWRVFFAEANLSLITSAECEDSDVTEEEAAKFLEALMDKDSGPEPLPDSSLNKDEEEVEDLLDLM